MAWTEQDSIDLAEWLALSPEMRIFEINHSRTPELELPTSPLPLLKDKGVATVSFRSTRAGNHFNLCTCGQLLPLEKILCPICDSQKIEYLEEKDSWYIGPQFKGFGQL